MKTVKVSAPGKIHLLGEHSVVYGKPALLAAIDKRCFVEITKRDDKKVVLIASNVPDFEMITEDEILAKDKTIAQPFDYVMLIIQQTMQYYEKRLPSGFSLVITNHIPEGRGLGSSAALAVAVAGAMTLFLKEDFDRKVINEIAFLSEKFIHGSPSGGDNSTSAFGGFVWFRKETDELKIIQQISLDISEKITQQFFLLDTGKPDETTGEMVGLVKKFVDKNPKKARKIFDEQEELVKKLLPALPKKTEAVLAIIKQGEKNLETLGVVSSSTKKVIRTIERMGGAAKICGAGGKAAGSGILLVCAKKETSNQMLNRYNTLSFGILFGEEGVRIEQ